MESVHIHLYMGAYVMSQLFSFVFYALTISDRKGYNMIGFICVSLENSHGNNNTKQENM